MRIGSDLLNNPRCGKVHSLKDGLEKLLYFEQGLIKVVAHGDDSATIKTSHDVDEVRDVSCESHSEMRVQTTVSWLAFLQISKLGPDPMEDVIQGGRIISVVTSIEVDFEFSEEPL